MLDFMSIFHSNYNDVTRITLFNFLKTGNPLYDAIISTFAISLFGFVVNYVYDYGIVRVLSNFSFDDIVCFFYRKNMIIIEGKKSSITSNYSMTYSISSIYSNRFKAIWDYIISNIDTNKTIFSIKEAHSNFQSSENNNDAKRKNLDIYMVHQRRHFKIDEHIFVKAEIEKEDDNDEKEKVKTKTDKITIYLYSYKYNVSYLKNYVDNITEKYLASIKDNRLNNKFIYCLEKVKASEDESRLDCWGEHKFDSARTFKNMFFDGKKELITKIDFFLNNRSWYYEKGIPYALGIGLHGPPGTGKTSLIKALANHTGRHIIMVSLKMIKTKAQLENFFFESKYNENNENDSISFDKKIIVFEDIDCIGEIILDRSKKSHDAKVKLHDKKKYMTEDINVSDVIQTICKINETTPMNILPCQDQPITLDDILNLWDGVRETPGRILVISSNHYDKLDPALVRPGRIDITHELSNSSRNVISEIYTHLFHKEINKTKLAKVKDKFYSPAELINIYIATGRNEDAFVKQLLENKKL
jgi:ATP-dependent 26S proteasome regulatory subunit